MKGHDGYSTKESLPQVDVVNRSREQFSLSDSHDARRQAFAASHRNDQ